MRFEKENKVSTTTTTWKFVKNIPPRSSKRFATQPNKQTKTKTKPKRLIERPTDCDQPIEPPPQSPPSFFLSIYLCLSYCDRNTFKSNSTNFIQLQLQLHKLQLQIQKPNIKILFDLKRDFIKSNHTFNSWCQATVQCTYIIRGGNILRKRLKIWIYFFQQFLWSVLVLSVSTFLNCS